MRAFREQLLLAVAGDTVRHATPEIRGQRAGQRQPECGAPAKHVSGTLYPGAVISNGNKINPVERVRPRRRIRFDGRHRGGDGCVQLSGVFGQRGPRVRDDAAQRARRVVVESAPPPVRAPEAPEGLYGIEAWVGTSPRSGAGLQ